MQAKELKKIIAELTHYAELVSDEQVKKLADLCYHSRRIFVAGAGRSGFAARGFANRLMQLGMETYLVGETVTPAINSEDLLIICSGSGRTSSLLSDAKKTTEIGAALATLTIFPLAPIGQLANAVIEIPGGTPKKDRAVQDVVKSFQPMGTLFEQLSWLVFDSIILELMKLTENTEDKMFSRHANLE